MSENMSIKLKIQLKKNCPKLETVTQLIDMKMT